LKPNVEALGNEIGSSGEDKDWTNSSRDSTTRGKYNLTSINTSQANARIGTPSTQSAVVISGSDTRREYIDTAITARRAATASRLALLNLHLILYSSTTGFLHHG
jgi:hypothetical protein